MKAKPVRACVLEQALSATVKSRNDSYGDPFPNLCIAAELKATYKRAAGNKYHPSHDEAIDMVLSKIARIACGAVGHTDNYVDAAAYMAIAAECQVEADIIRENAEAAAAEYTGNITIKNYEEQEPEARPFKPRKPFEPFFQSHDETQD